MVMREECAFSSDVSFKTRILFCDESATEQTGVAVSI
jgi:hypothetical protein